MSPVVRSKVPHPHGFLVAVAPPEERDWIDPDALASLLPEERVAIAAHGPRRQETWLLGRTALIEALAAIGAPRTPLLSDPRGRPIVPAGFRGSISHKPNLAVAIAEIDRGAAIGVDLEGTERPRPAIASRVLTPLELAALDRLPADSSWIALLARFALKEAIYKAIDPWVARYVAFQEAEIAELSLPPLSSLEAPEFCAVEARMTMANGEGPFVIELSLARTEVLLATARIRPR